MLEQRLQVWVLCYSVISSHLGGRVVGSAGAQPRGWHARMSQLYQLSPSFSYKLVNSILLNKKVELLLIAQNNLLILIYFLFQWHHNDLCEMKLMSQDSL